MAAAAKKRAKPENENKNRKEQPEKKIGNRRVAKYSFEMDEPQFGETTEIRIKVVDKYKKETVSDNEFEYYD